MRSDSVNTGASTSVTSVDTDSADSADSANKKRKRALVNSTDDELALKRLRLGLLRGNNIDPDQLLPGNVTMGSFAWQYLFENYVNRRRPHKAQGRQSRSLATSGQAKGQGKGPKRSKDLKASAGLGAKDSAGLGAKTSAGLGSKAKESKDKPISATLTLAPTPPDPAVVKRPVLVVTGTAKSSRSHETRQTKEQAAKATSTSASRSR